jgi:hypothetical protein
MGFHALLLGDAILNSVFLSCRPRSFADHLLFSGSLTICEHDSSATRLCITLNINGFLLHDAHNNHISCADALPVCIFFNLCHFTFLPSPQQDKLDCCRCYTGFLGQPKHYPTFPILLYRSPKLLARGYHDEQVSSHAAAAATCGSRVMQPNTTFICSRYMRCARSDILHVSRCCRKYVLLSRQ